MNNDAAETGEPHARVRGAPPADPDQGGESGDLRDLLMELRVALQGAQVMTAFLVTLPFSSGFGKLGTVEQGLYLATFLCSVVSLVLLSAPALHHRLERPVRNRARFKRFASRLVIAGLVPLTLSLVLATGLVAEEVVGGPAALALTILFAMFIGAVWWMIPLLRAKLDREPPRGSDDPAGTGHQL